jgi:hypothetical protein
VNRMSLDEAIVFRRHAPDSDAATWASFNLGELLFGAGDPRSLVPLLLLMLGAGAVVTRMARRSAPAA